jgi:hypothetical protein
MLYETLLELEKAKVDSSSGEGWKNIMNQKIKRRLLNIWSRSSKLCRKNSKL